MTYYTIYQTTCLVNSKIYVGMHKTNNLQDEYLGSGNMLKRAIKKYGIHNFTKEILFIFDNEQDMINKEKELVNEDFCNLSTTYNICQGGKGGSLRKGIVLSSETKQKISKSIKEHYINNTEIYKERYKKRIINVTEEYRQKLRDKKKNLVWLTSPDFSISKQYNSETEEFHNKILEGWIRGRKAWKPHNKK